LKGLFEFFKGQHENVAGAKLEGHLQHVSSHHERDVEMIQTLLWKTMFSDWMTLHVTTSFLNNIYYMIKYNNIPK
jgi:hypothetical protein